MVALVRSWQDLAKILASIPMHLGKRAKIRVTGELRVPQKMKVKIFEVSASFIDNHGKTCSMHLTFLNNFFLLVLSKLAAAKNNTLKNSESRGIFCACNITLFQVRDLS